jgi:cytochrome c oxidase subunit 3
MRRWTQYWWYMLATIICGTIFLVVKLSYEWPAKFEHFGVFIRKESAAKYEKYLGNEHLAAKKLTPRYEISGHLIGVEIERDGKKETIKGKDEHEGVPPSEAAKLAVTPGVKILSYEMHLDPINAEPENPEHDRPHFWVVPPTEEAATIQAEDIVPNGASAFLPRHSTYFSCYFLITGLHGLHVLGGVIVFIYFFLFGKELYLRNPEHMANRVEVAGLFWHFVDLVWIFVFPIFYLL